MSTVAAPQAMLQAPARLGSHDRLFYGSVAVAMALMAIVGFGPTFYLRLFSGGPMATFGAGRPFTPLVYLHGVLFTAWVALFILQTALISAPRRRHRLRSRVAAAHSPRLCLGRCPARFVGAVPARDLRHGDVDGNRAGADEISDSLQWA